MLEIPHTLSIWIGLWESNSVPASHQRSVIGLSFIAFVLVFLSAQQNQQTAL